MTHLVTPAGNGLTLIANRSDAPSLDSRFLEVNSTAVAERWLAPDRGKFIFAALMPLDLERLLCACDSSNGLLIRVK